MRFAEFFQSGRGPVISFEVFPPKTDSAMEQLQRVLPELVALGPSYMTVTYGAMGSTQHRTLQIATLLRHRYDVQTACHLTCVGSSRDQIERILHAIHCEGIENIVALRGDPPKGQERFVPPSDGYAYANELVAHIRRFDPGDGFGGFGVAVAGYPEKHQEAADMARDLANLKRKVDTGADIVITQLFFDNSVFFRFLQQAQALGIQKPIVPGLLPILSAKQIRRISSMCGSKIPPVLQAELEAAGADDSQAEQVGIRQCVAQATELLQRGAPGVHFYVLNKSRHMVRIMEQIRPLL